MQKVAPTLIVEKVEPTMDFMIQKLGFEKVMDVPGEEGLNFAMMVNGNAEIHLQTHASACKELPYFVGATLPPRSFLYIDVDDVRALYEQLKDTDVILPLERTFYGATHFFLREPGGHVFGFSQNNT